MPYSPEYTVQNVSDVFQPQFKELFIPRIKPGGFRFDTFFMPEPAIGEKVVERQYRPTTVGGHVLADDHGKFIPDAVDMYVRDCRPVTIYKTLVITSDEMANMSKGYGIEHQVTQAVDGCMHSWHREILSYFEKNVDSKDNKVFKWDASKMTIPIDADPYKAPDAQQPPPFSANWDLGLTTSKIARARNILRRNGCAEPYILFADDEALGSLRNDPRYSGNEFAYERALETVNMRPYGGVTGIFNIQDMPLRTSIVAGKGVVPAGTKVQISYLVATDYIKTYVVRDWDVEVTRPHDNTLQYWVTANGRMAGMRMEEAAVVAIESHYPDTEVLAQNPERR